MLPFPYDFNDKPTPFLCPRCFSSPIKPRSIQLHCSILSVPEFVSSNRITKKKQLVRSKNSSLGLFPLFKQSNDQQSARIRTDWRKKTTSMKWWTIIWSFNVKKLQKLQTHCPTASDKAAGMEGGTWDRKFISVLYHLGWLNHVVINGIRTISTRVGFQPPAASLISILHVFVTGFYVSPCLRKAYSPWF